MTSGNINIYFTGNVFLNGNMDFNLIGGNTSQVYWETLGNWDQNNGFGEWFGTIFASGATSHINLGADMTLNGRAWARDYVADIQALRQIDPVVVNPNLSSVPEPATVGLLGIGLLGLAAKARRLRVRKQ